MKMKYESFEELITLIRDTKEHSCVKLLIILTNINNKKCQTNFKRYPS